MRTRAIPGHRYGIDDANGMRLFTARLVQVGDRDDPRLKLDQIKLKAGKDVLLGGQVVLANHSSTLKVMKVVLDAPSLRSAFGLKRDAAYGVDPSVEDLVLVLGAVDRCAHEAKSCNLCDMCWPLLELSLIHI